MNGTKWAHQAKLIYEKAGRRDHKHCSDPYIAEASMRECAFRQSKLQPAGHNGEYGQKGMGWDRLSCRQKRFEIHIRFVA